MAVGSHPWRGTSAAFTPNPAIRRTNASTAKLRGMVAIAGFPPATNSSVFPVASRAIMPARTATPPLWV